MISHFTFKAQNYNILIVEDSKLINHVLFETFEKYGYNCFQCETIKEATKILKENTIHYILLDINLPDGNGYDLILKLKEAHTGIFVLSGAEDKDFQEKTYEEGVIEFIKKDHNFFYKTEDISQKIQRLEENQLSTVLVVDDSKVIRAQLGNLLKDRNYKVEFAKDSDTAIDIVLNKKIDLILLDVQLQNSNGIEFLQRYKAQILLKRNITVIIISGYVTPTIIRDGLKAGAVDVIKKPFVPEEIILKVNMWIDYKQKQKDIEESTKLLNQYKETVDRSYIVSKTDENGIITYVNDEFCRLTQYSKDELIGNSHKILRDPKTPKKNFEKLWNTIKIEKKPWHNNIKNKNKSGKSYWVNTMINPILDQDGDVVEFIAISRDVTNDQRMKEYFKYQINTSSENFENAINISNEYQRAMSEGSIVSRTDLNGYITYVNDQFCKIFGYKKEELIGQNHNIIRHPDMKKEVYQDLWLTIKGGNTWKGIIKNMGKRGHTYWLNSTIVPIKDKSGKTIEYMGIRSDLTSLFNLHEEIDYTQKEIIYRMGEIGETRSKETGNHVKRVATYSKVLATYYGLSEEEIDLIFTASPMHDIGKVGIEDSILKKPGKLTPEEFETMKSHAMIGYNILKDSERKVLKAAAIVSKEHHEKWDGSGYPQGLKGKEIHIYGRITALADVFDALGSERCYKKAWEDERIFKLLKEERGKHFDPKLIDIFFEHLDEFLKIRDRYKD